MSSHKPKKTHHIVKPGDRFTKCGREVGKLNMPLTTRTADVTCQHCLTPNKPFTVSPLGG